MAANVQSVSTPSNEIHSLVLSDSAQWTQAGDVDPQHRFSRPGRSPSRPLLRTSFRHFTGFATVIVGEKGNESRPETTYLVHKELLTSASPFFAAALNGTFAEGLDQRVHLREEKPDVFEWFLQWLYTGTLNTQPAWSEPLLPRARNRSSDSYHDNSNSSTTITQTSPPPPLAPSPLSDARLDGDLRNAAGSPKYFLLLDLYALSDRLLTTPLSNHILSTIARLSEASNSVPTPSDTWILYESASFRDASPARALVLDLFAYKKTDCLLETHPDEWHPRFLRDLVVKLKRPGPDALDRHALVAWHPRSWSRTRACDACRELLRPGERSGDRCAACAKAFCNACVRRHALDAAAAAAATPASASASVAAASPGSGIWAGPHDAAGCKPWSGAGMCRRYHEHADGEACG